MTDYSELKRLAEASSQSEEGSPMGRSLKIASFYSLATPAAVLALIAENEGLRNGLHDIAKKASESRSVTRRLTWIEGRAESALLGKQWCKNVFMMPDPKNGKPKAERLEAENKQLKSEVRTLRNVANELRSGVSCEHLHHGLADQHGYDEPCKLIARIDRAMSNGEQP